MSEALSHFQSVWQHKPILRLMYDDLFERAAAHIVEGRALEIGGGIGNLKQKVNGLISSDIQFAPWLDLVADAQNLPFQGESVSNIVMVDVLHHLEFPSLLFREASRVLRPGGRIIMVEPAITLGSTFFYRFLHQEPVDMSVDPLIEGQRNQGRDPYLSNQALPTLLVTKWRDNFHAKFPEFHISEVRWFSMFAYPLSGGFKSWSLLTLSMARALLSLERLIEKTLGRFFGFRMLIVIEKKLA